MEVLAIINKILGLKIVQWALLVFFVAASGVILYQTLHLKLAKIQIASLEADSDKKEGLIIKQNAGIADWKAKGDTAKLKIDAAKAESVKVAADYERRIASLKKHPIREDCCGAIEDAKNILLGVTP